MDVSAIRAVTESVRGEVRKALVGQDETVELLLTSLLVGGHVLIEGVPGTAKTLMTRAFGAALALQFGRIQFTPDLMPGDVLGTNLFNFQTNSFVLTKGPIFAQLLLADEINRTPPKTQAALLQAMNERIVTIDGKDYSLGDDFMVVATQNPIEQQGTYPLPEAQLDRFLFKVIVDHPSRDEEREIVRRHGHRSAMPRLEEFGLKAIAELGGAGKDARGGDPHSPLRSAGRLYCRRDPRDARAFVPRSRRLDPRRQHAGGRRAGVRDSPGPRFRHSRRRQNPRLAGAAPPARHVAKRGDRGGNAGSGAARGARADASAAMIRPSPRAVLLFVSGIPLTLIAVIYSPNLWPLSVSYGVLVLVIAASDLGLALPPRQLDIDISMPDKIYIGERGAVIAELSAPRYRRSVGFELIAEQRGEVERSDVVSARLTAGEKARIALPVVPRRRGRVRVEHVWIRWRGPLGLIEFIRKIPVDRAIDVLPNVRGVHGSALQFYMQEAIYGIKTQLQQGEGAEFDALREYMVGLDSRFIDWKHSARHRKLLCKEFRTERNHQVMMAFDTGYLMLEPVDGIARLDHAINAGLVLAWVVAPGRRSGRHLRVRRAGSAICRSGPRRIEPGADRARDRGAYL